MENQNKFSHVDADGKASMVDVGEKPIQKRKAVAKGKILLAKETTELIRENKMKKGDVLTVAQIAGIQAAKQTPGLIPLCHTLILDKVDVKCTLVEDGVAVCCTVFCQGKTGVEMEALTGTSVALLTIYDMCKAVDKRMVITEITLLEKEKKDIGYEQHS
jgi:cyclic pyranopterin phosphate synthase